MNDCTVRDLLITAIADILSFIKPYAMLLFKIFEGLIVGRTGGTFNTARDELLASIFIMKVMDTEVEVVIKRAFVIPARKVMRLYFF